MQMPSESSNARRPRQPATSLATSTPSNGLMRAGSPSSVWWTGLPVSIVAVQARAVGLRVEPGHGALVGGADRPARARPPLVLRLVDGLALVRPLPDDRHVAVVHAARVALVPAMVEALAQPRRLPRLHVHVAGDARRVVPDRQRRHLRDVHDAWQL